MNKFTWLPWVLPFATYLVLGSLFDPLSVPGSGETDSWIARTFSVPQSTAYPISYSLRLILSTAALVWSMRRLTKQNLRDANLVESPHDAAPRPSVIEPTSPSTNSQDTDSKNRQNVMLNRFRIHPLAIGCGIVGCFLWIGINHLHLEQSVASALGQQAAWDSMTARESYDPISQLGSAPTVFYLFCAMRLFGLAVVVPIIEEWFLRGFLLRFLSNDDWERLSLQSLGPQAYAIAAAYGALTHPGEAIAAIIWFSLITWLMFRTGRLWDCIVAHAVTNLLLGIYVIVYHQWWLW